MGQFMGTKEASERWGYSQSAISKWCRDGLIPDVEQDKQGSPWRIPSNTKCPRKIKGKENQK